MSLTQERLEIANHAVRQTFERSSVAWQAIPHWDVGDPGRVRVRGDTGFRIAGRSGAQDLVNPDDPLPNDPVAVQQAERVFTIRLAQAVAPTPDALLAAVIPRTVALARAVDQVVVQAISAPAIATQAQGNPPGRPWLIPVDVTIPALPVGGGQPQPPRAESILNGLLAAREVLEDSGYQAPSCLVVSGAWLGWLNSFQGSYPAYESLLVGANVNAVHRTSLLPTVQINNAPRPIMLMVGRNAEIPPGRAPEASPGEEPVDVAVIVTPSLEYAGENQVGAIELAARIRFAVRFKDERGVVVLYGDPVP
jgi:hypothetical protein